MSMTSSGTEPAGHGLGDAGQSGRGRLGRGRDGRCPRPAYGGGALSLRYVAAELRNVMDLVQHANYEVATGRRLLTIVADLAQLLGWLHSTPAGTDLPSDTCCSAWEC